MCKVRNDAAEEIEQQIAEVTESVFHVVSEDVKEEHVSTDMKNVGVKEDGCEEGVKVFSLKYFVWNHGEIVEKPVYQWVYGVVFWEKCEEQ